MIKQKRNYYEKNTRLITYEFHYFTDCMQWSGDRVRGPFKPSGKRSDQQRKQKKLLNRIHGKRVS